MTDLLVQLQRASWRQIEFPVMGTRDFGFQHEQAEHRYIFKDVQLIESLGRKNQTYKYVIPFREDIALGPWANLFTSVYPDFLDACQNRERGVLVDPAHGALPAKCVSFREILTVDRRDGVDVEVEFIHSPTEDDVVQDRGTVIRTLEGARGMAGAFDREIAKIPFTQEASPRPTISPLDAISAVTSQVEVGLNKVSASFADAAFRVEKATASIERLKDPTNQPALQQAARLRNALISLEETTDPTCVRPLGRISVATDKTISAVAAKLGMTIQELVRLNPFLARTPLVRAGTQLRVFSDAIRPANARAT
jgi:prophage DNA circulation protein